MPDRNPHFLPSVLDLLLDAVCVVDAEGHFVFVSAACEPIFGYRPEEMVGRRMIEMVAPEDRERTLQAAQRIMAGESHLHFENRYLRKDGKRVDIMWSARWSESNQVRIAVARDVTARKRAYSVQAATYAISEAAHAAADLASMLRQIHLVIGELVPCQNFAVALIDERNGDLHFPYVMNSGSVDRPALHPSGVSFCQDVIQGQLTCLVGRETAAEGPLASHNPADAGLSSRLGIPLSTSRGVIGALVLDRDSAGAPYTEEDKELLQFVSTQIASAIERKQLYARLQHMAQYDALTDLPNRAFLEDRMKTAIARVRREGLHLSVLYLDLDKFKQVNDTFGHAAGDQLLKDFARRLKSCVRESDTVARMSGDEFVVLLQSSQKQEGNQVVTQKIWAEFDKPFHLDGQALHIRPSIGVAQYPEHGTDPQHLLRHADNAMYAMKTSRR